MFAGIAWHPDPAQSSDSVQLVTASADKTACFLSGEGKQLGTLEVSRLFSPDPLHTESRHDGCFFSFLCQLAEAPVTQGVLQCFIAWAALLAMLSFFDAVAHQLFPVVI